MGVPYFLFFISMPNKKRNQMRQLKYLFIHLFLHEYLNIN